MTRTVQRLTQLLLTLLGIAYAVVGALFISTGNAGGVSLGMMFLGGAGFLYVAFSIQQQMAQMRELLTLLVIRNRAQNTAQSSETKDEAQGASRPRPDIAVSHGD